MPARSTLLAAAAVLATAAALWAQGGRYATEIRTWLAEDRLNPPPAGAVLFAGSSSIRRWESLAQEFAHYDTIQRGFGGSQFSDLNGYVDDIVLPYDPAAIVVFEGTNDVAAGKSAETVFADYLTFVAAVHGGQNQSRPPIPILYIGITPTPSRWAAWGTASAVNARIASHCLTDPSLFYIDTPSVFLATGQPPSSSLFVPDQLHLNPTGYALWTSVVRPAVEAVVPATKRYTPNPFHPPAGASLLLDLGPNDGSNGHWAPSPDANGHHWNHWHPRAGGAAVLAGESLGDLVTTTGAPTGIDLVITGGFLTNGLQNGGLRSPQSALLGTLAIGEATEDYFFGDDLDAPAGFMLTGLDGSAVYDLRLFASRDTTETRITRYLASGRHTPVALDLQTSGSGLGVTPGYNGNESHVAEIDGLVPDAYGQLFVDLHKVAGSFDYLNACEIAVRAPAVTKLPPGCGIAAAPPHLDAAVPRLGGAWPVTASGFDPGRVCGLYLSLGEVAPVAFGGCLLYVDAGNAGNLALWALGSTGAAGTWSTTSRLPSLPDLYGRQLLAQAFDITPRAAAGFELSNGIRAPIGQ